MDETTDRVAARAAGRRRLRIQAGTVAGFVFGVAVAWGCGGLFTFMLFYHAGMHDAAALFWLLTGAACVAFFTWAGNAMMKSVDKYGW